MGLKLIYMRAIIIIKGWSMLMNIQGIEYYIRLGLILISLFPTMIGFRIIKVMSKTAYSLCYSNIGAIIFLSILGLPQHLVIIFIIASSLAFICDKFHLINYKKFVVFFPGENFEQIVRDDERLNDCLSMRGSFITFTISDKKIIKEKIEILLDIKENVNLDFKTRLGILLLFNLCLITSILRFIDILIS